MQGSRGIQDRLFGKKYNDSFIKFLFFFFEISDTENIYTALVKSLEVILKLELRILKRKLEFRNLKKWFLDTNGFTESTKVEYTRYSKGYKYISIYYDV